MARPNPISIYFVTICIYIGKDATYVANTCWCCCCDTHSHCVMCQCCRCDKLFVTQKAVNQHISFWILVKPGSRKLYSQLGQRRAGGPGRPAAGPGGLVVSDSNSWAAQLKYFHEGLNVPRGPSHEYRIVILSRAGAGAPDSSACATAASRVAAPLLQGSSKLVEQLVCKKFKSLVPGPPWLTPSLACPSLRQPRIWRKLE